MKMEAQIAVKKQEGKERNPIKRKSFVGEKELNKEQREGSDKNETPRHPQAAQITVRHLLTKVSTKRKRYVG